MRYSCWTIIVIGFNLLFSACRLEKREPSDIIVSVGDRYLMRQMLNDVVPIGLSANDSSLFADSYIRHWVEDELIYDIAQKNISDAERIESLVNKYRHELFVYEYQKQLLNEKFDAEVPTESAKNYYRVHLDKFVLKSPIIKGLFLKVSETSSEINELKKWYRNMDNTSIDRIEKYNFHNLVTYEYFYDRWVSFDEVMYVIPYNILDANRFLASHKYLEVNEGGYWYLLNISDYLPAGANMPFDFAKAQIDEILLNQKRMDFLHQMNKELYQEALEDRKIRYYGRAY